MAVASPPGPSNVAAERSGAPLESRFRIADLGDVAYLLYFVLPRRALLEIGRIRGWAEYLLRGKMRRAVRRNVRDLVPTAGTCTCTGSSEVSRVAKHSLRSDRPGCTGGATC